MPISMTLTGKGQFTFNKQLMEHLNIKAGERIVIKRQPDASLRIEAEKKKIDILSLANSVKSDIRLTDEEIEETIKSAYVVAGMAGLK